MSHKNYAKHQAKEKWTSTARNVVNGLRMAENAQSRAEASRTSEEPPTKTDPTPTPTVGILHTSTCFFSSVSTIFSTPRCQPNMPPPPPLSLAPPTILLRPNPFYESLGDLRVHPDVLHLIQSMHPALPPTARVWCPSGQAQWLACVPEGVDVRLGMAEVEKVVRARTQMTHMTQRTQRTQRTHMTQRTQSRRQQRATQTRARGGRAATRTTRITLITLHITPSPNTSTPPPHPSLRALATTLRHTLKALGIPFYRQWIATPPTHRPPLVVPTPSLAMASPTTIWSPLAIERMTRACTVTTDTINALYAKIRTDPFPSPAFPNTLAMRAFLVDGIRTRLGLPVSTPEEDFLAYPPILMVDGGGEALIRKTGIARVHPEGVEDVAFRPLANAASVPAQMVLLDIGARYGGFCADITRTFVMHPDLNAHLDAAPSAEQRTIYNAVKAVHDFAVGEMRPGVSYEEVERRVQDQLNGYLGDFVGSPVSPMCTPLRITKMPHHLGHTVGTQVHAHPPIEVLERRRGGVLEAGMVLTVEPGVYTDRCCVRIENVVVVGEGGGRVVSGGCGW